MTRPQPLASTTVGIIVERRKAKSRWVDHVWRPVAALPGVPATPPWTALEGDEEEMRFFAGSADIGLYRADTPHYRDNLASGRPGLWVVLRPTAGTPPLELVAVTANPSEGESFTESGAYLVEPVPIPEPVVEMIETFIAENPFEHEFTKRKRNRADPDALARRAPADRAGKERKP